MILKIKARREIVRIKIVFYILLVSTLFISCSRRTVAKDPPKVRQTLVVDLFAALQDGDHSSAIEKIRRLREIKDSSFLAQLEMVEIQNSAIAEIQSKINEGKLDEAIELRSKAIITIPRNEKLIQAKETINTLKQIQLLVDSITTNSDWVSVARSSGRLKSIASSYPPAKILSSAADRKLIEAKNIMLRKHKISIIDMAAEINSIHSDDQKKRAALMALLFVSDPQNPIFKYQEQENLLF